MPPCVFANEEYVSQKLRGNPPLADLNSNVADSDELILLKRSNKVPITQCFAMVKLRIFSLQQVTLGEKVQCI